MVNMGHAEPSAIKGPVPHFHYWRPVDSRYPEADLKQFLIQGIPMMSSDLEDLIIRFDTRLRDMVARIADLFSTRLGHSGRTEPEIRTLFRSWHGYVDRTKAYRRLQEWQMESGWGYSLATVMSCRQWEICSAPLA